MIFWGSLCWCTSKKWAHWRRPNMTKITILVPLPFIYCLTYNNIMCLKRSQFLWRFMIMKMKIYFKVKNLKNVNFFCFHPCHVGVLCSKTLTLNRTPWIWSDFDNFHIFQHFFFLKNMNLPGPIWISHVWNFGPP